jgi:acetaldehyde dehydrogenase (acetylating)
MICPEHHQHQQNFIQGMADLVTLSSGQQHMARVRRLHQEHRHQGEEWLVNLPALYQHRKILQQEAPVQANLGHSEANSQAREVVSHASLQDAGVIAGIVVGVVGVAGVIINGCIRILSCWQERRPAAPMVCTCSFLLTGIR